MLESGFDIFRAMKGAQEFIAIIGEREHDFAAALFEAGSGGVEGHRALERALGGLAPE